MEWQNKTSRLTEANKPFDSTKRAVWFKHLSHLPKAHGRKQEMECSKQTLSKHKFCKKQEDDRRT
jgi:hypothetical protein